MAKFVKLIRKNHIHNGFKFEPGLNHDIGKELTTTECGDDGFYFTDTNNMFMWKAYNGDPMFWVYDVEIPDGEVFIAYTTKYKASKIILSNPRQLWKDDNTYKAIDFRISLVNHPDLEDLVHPDIKDMFIKSKNYSEEFRYHQDPRTYIAKKDNNHILVLTNNFL